MSGNVKWQRGRFRARNVGTAEIMAGNRNSLRKPSPGGLAITAVIAVLLLLSLLFPVGTALAADGHVSSQTLAPRGDTGSGPLEQGQGEPARPNPLIFLDIWLFGGLILLVMIVVAVKYIWQYFQPDDRDPSEGLQPWEDPDYPYEESEE